MLDFKQQRYEKCLIFKFSRININFFHQEGEFWRILLPGIYTMEVFAEGFAPREVQFAIVEQNPTMLNITLYKVRKETFVK